MVKGIADLARQALSSDPAAAEQLKRYEAAVVALEKARAKEKELEKIMLVRGLVGGTVTAAGLLLMLVPATPTAPAEPPARPSAPSRPSPTPPPPPCYLRRPPSKRSRRRRRSRWRCGRGRTRSWPMQRWRLPRSWSERRRSGRPWRSATCPAPAGCGGQIVRRGGGGGRQGRGRLRVWACTPLLPCLS